MHGRQMNSRLSVLVKGDLIKKKKGYITIKEWLTFSCIYKIRDCFYDRMKCPIYCDGGCVLCHLEC